MTGPAAATDPAVRPAALLLDLDGTLVLSERVHRLTWQRFFDTWGVEVDDDEYARTYLGRRACDVLAQVPGPWTGTDLGDVDDVVRAMTEHAVELGSGVEVVPGAAGLVRAAAGRGVPVAVVTSADDRWAEQLLRASVGVRDLVRVLVTSEHVEVGKPSPQGYALACERLGVAASGTVGVEDSPSGVRALVGAGVGTVVGITTTAPDDVLRASGAHLTVRDLTDRTLRAMLAARRPARAQ